jgi:hypothetical protein
MLMPEHETVMPTPPYESVEAFIERIVARANIPSRAEREDVRRELWTHFEEAGMSPEAVRGAMRRFGAEAMVAESLRRVYRWDYIFVYLAKIAASIIASIAAALLIEVLVNLRVELQAEALRLAPGFSHAAVLSVAVVLALVTAREVGRAPFNRSRALAALSAYAAVCAVVQLVFASAGAFVAATVLVVLGHACSRLRGRAAQVLLTFVVFAAAEYGIHLVRSVAFSPSRALVAGAVLLTVCASTVVILARVDHMFGNLLETV